MNFIRIGRDILDRSILMLFSTIIWAIIIAIFGYKVSNENSVYIVLEAISGLSAGLILTSLISNSTPIEELKNLDFNNIQEIKNNLPTILKHGEYINNCIDKYYDFKSFIVFIIPLIFFTFIHKVYIFVSIGNQSEIFIASIVLGLWAGIAYNLYRFSEWNK